MRPGGVVAIDNVLWSGRVLESPDKQNAYTSAIHSLNQKIATDKRVNISMLPVADGLTLCYKK